MRCKTALVSCFVLAFPALIALAGCTQTREGLGPEGSGGKPTPPPLEVADKTVTEDGTVVAKLSNGLTVIVKAVRTAPVVTVHAYVGAGSMYEGRWLGCGLSHLTEHLVAKGAVHDMGEGQTAKEAKQTSDRVAEIGGQSNASTSLDHTRYYISAAAGRTMECIDLIADWMARPDILPEDFEREHGVVLRELELRKDNPRVQFWHTHMRNVYRTHPAAVPILGYADPLRKVTREDILAYHGKMYVPQNMVFVVAGDVKTADVLERVAQAFAGFAPGRLPDHRLPEVKTPAGTRRVATTHKAATEAMESLSFLTIPLVHEDLYALDVLS
ncbi:MAG TPA: pitrilysin family protein, partial [Phycisphaerae bacterium]|nr:pitrilysin family protein [Phycisphaerae bacterium]